MKKIVITSGSFKKGELKTTRELLLTHNNKKLDFIRIIELGKEKLS